MGKRGKEVMRMDRPECLCSVVHTPMPECGGIKGIPERQILNCISFSSPSIPDQSKEIILEVLGSKQFSPGSKVREFEQRFAALHKAKHAVFVNSGTDALRLSFLALKEKYGWKDGSCVAVPALTFVATVNVILQAGLRPFFVDVGMIDYCLNPWNLERRLEGSSVDLVAILPVHLFGQQADMLEILKMAEKRNWKVIEDSCETILNPIQGAVSCHSTYMAHHLTTGVGGLALTNDDELHELLRSYANHGRNVSYLPGYRRPAPTKELLKKRFQFDRIGYSCRATEFEAALGLAQLEGLEETIIKRCNRADSLRYFLSMISELRLPGALRSHTWMMFPVILREDSRIDKYDLCLHLEESGIETRDMMPVTNQPCYKEFFEGSSFSVADWVNRCGFYIPIYPSMTPGELWQIVRAFQSFPAFKSLTKKQTERIVVTNPAK